ncbi:MAG: polysaccharide deacetylase family protein [Magnetococcales bacterium]|nr:polysaccharide deacetylase family protein [Magnetococcales bacterium]
MLKRGTYHFPGHWAEQGPELPVRQAIRAVEQTFQADFPPCVPKPISWAALCQIHGIFCISLERVPLAEAARMLQQCQPDMGIILAPTGIDSLLFSIPRLGSLRLHGGPFFPGGKASPPGLRELSRGENQILLTLHWLAASDQTDGTLVARHDVAIEPCATPESLAILTRQSGVLLVHDFLMAHATRPGVDSPTLSHRVRGFLSERSCLLATANHGLASDSPVPDLPTPRLSGQATRSYRRRILEMQRYRNMSPAEQAEKILTESAQYLQGHPASRERLAQFSACGDAPILVFYYHRTANDHGHGITLPLEEFARQVTFMQRHADLLSLDAAIQRLERRCNPRLAVVITIDDGYARDLTTSLPWLEMRGYPAALFITPGLMLQRATPLGFDLMTPDDVRHLRQRGFDIGSHTMWHADLGQNTGPQVDIELRRSREILEEILREPVRHFAFPFGVHGKNITREAFAKAHALYPYLLSAYGGYNFPSRFDSVHVRRFPTPGSVLEVARLLAGFVPGWMDPHQKVPWETPVNTIPPF